MIPIVSEQVTQRVFGHIPLMRSTPNRAESPAHKRHRFQNWPWARNKVVAAAFSPRGRHPLFTAVPVADSQKSKDPPFRIGACRG
jgi:hypothetical protein